MDDYRVSYQRLVEALPSHGRDVVLNDGDVAGAARKMTEFLRSDVSARGLKIGNSNLTIDLSLTEMSACALGVMISQEIANQLSHRILVELATNSIVLCPGVDAHSS
ncbi:hypothetical protein [Streptomyces sp. NPDC090080]|uniref:hypothetical protein n=1 Tax=Streptomyces sp. NPDC090080 TaxID=3365939 RepID=UPI003830CE4B